MTCADKIVVRDKEIQWLIENNCSFAQVLHLVFTGHRCDPYVEKILNGILVAFCDHGLNPPSTNAARFAASCGAPLNAAVVAGLSCMGEFHAPIESCAKMLSTALMESEPAEDLVMRYRALRRRIPGYGHPIHHLDPRVGPLIAMSEEGPHLKLAKEIGFALEESCARRISLNAAGASAALLCDCGLPPEFANAFFIIGRTVGLVAHAVEESHDKHKVKVT